MLCVQTSFAPECYGLGPGARFVLVMPARIVREGNIATAHMLSNINCGDVVMW